MQLAPYQRMHVLGTKGRIEVEIPFNPSPDRATRLLVDDGSTGFGSPPHVEEIAACDQFTIQGDLFARAILEDRPVAVPLEDSLCNMAVIEAVQRSAASELWETPEKALSLLRE